MGPNPLHFGAPAQPAISDRMLGVFAADQQRAQQEAQMNNTALQQSLGQQPQQPPQLAPQRSMTVPQMQGQEIMSSPFGTTFGSTGNTGFVTQQKFTAPRFW